MFPLAICSLLLAGGRAKIRTPWQTYSSPVQSLGYPDIARDLK
jgi:hypothetical protein